MNSFEKREYLENKGYDSVAVTQSNSKYTCNIWSLKEDFSIVKDKLSKGEMEFNYAIDAVANAVDMIYDRVKK